MVLVNGILFSIFDDPVARLLFAVMLMAISGLPGLFIKKPGWGQNMAAAALVIGATLGLSGAGTILVSDAQASYQTISSFPFGAFKISADPLSALFLLPLFLTSACCGVYATAYWPAADHLASEKKMTFFFGLLVSSMAMVVLARHTVLLLMAWEVMALSGYFLLTTEQQDAAVQRAGTVYIISAHLGTMALFVMVALLKATSGTFVFPGAQTLAPDGGLTMVILLLALTGFGAKAGIVPLHIWLPGAHANAPSHVSATMSGVMLKMGVYGILRVASFFVQIPVWFGGLILALGAISAVTGIGLAAAQRDLKRLLAYSSIENIGIIFLGIGLGFIGLQNHAPSLVVLGLAGGFIHIINHGIFKPILFLGSGAIIHAAGTREIDRMGGLAHRIPRTAPLFLIGVISICGLPPLNGFIGELCIYFAAFANGVVSPFPILALVAPLLAFAGGLAIITFVKLYGVVFLGAPRSTYNLSPGHENSFAMVAPIALLAVSCLIFGVVAPLGLWLAAPVVKQYGGVSILVWNEITEILPLSAIMALNAVLLLLVLLLGLTYQRRIRRIPSACGPTWGCGYLAPSSRMQYTGTSFSEPVVNLLGKIIGPQRHYPSYIGKRPRAGPGPSRFSYEMTETILNRLLVPLFNKLDSFFSFLRRLQHGQLHMYILYIFVTLFTLMAWRH